MEFNHIKTNKFYLSHEIDNEPMSIEFKTHFHVYTEIAYFISGDVTYQVEGREFQPKPRDIFIARPNEMHKTVVNSNAPYERIVMSIRRDIFSGFDYDETTFKALSFENSKGINLIKSGDFGDDYWEQCLKKIMSITDNDPIRITSYLIPFLRELIYLIENSNIALQENKELHIQIIDYINANLTEDLTATSIAKEFFISRSKLDKLCRNRIGTSLGEYVSSKRLAFAREMLRQGERVATVYSKCGYKEYTAFYRAYKAKFGVSPKNDKNIII